VLDIKFFFKKNNIYINFFKMFTKFRKTLNLCTLPLGFYFANEWNNRFRKPQCCGILGVLTV
jgi:hypothetical protein